MLIDDHLLLLEAGSLREFVEIVALDCGKFLARYEQFDPTSIFVAYLIVVDDGIAERLVLLDEPDGLVFEVVVLYESHCGPDARDNEYDHHHCNNPLGPFLRLAVAELHHIEAENLGREVGGEGDEHAVDKEEVESAEEIAHVAVRETISCRTHRRHEGCRYGHSGEHRALFLAALLEYSGAASEESDEHVINRRVCPRQKLGRVAEVQRGDEKVEA